jgi:D-glycero-alpha-D-manno-heptose-7-phosphate kinase
MIYRSKAPLRLGFAGGGTDVSPYTDKFGGAVLNATINLFAHASIEVIDEQVIVLHDITDQKHLSYNVQDQLQIDGNLDLIKAVYNYMQRRYGLPNQGLRITCAADTPAGCGLGTSSTMMVAIIGVFAEMLQLSLSKYEIANLAYDLERIELGFAGGRQDQYAASFGGINFIEFAKDGTAIVHPLAVEKNILEELENNLVLYYTGYSRQSGAIIRQQQEHVRENHTENIEAMHALKKQATKMRDALQAGRLQEIGELFDYGFMYKRKMAGNISNEAIEKIYDAAKKAGATGGKISGAGGGGFMFFYCPANTRFQVIETLNSFDGQVWPCSFSEQGMISWHTA